MLLVRYICQQTENLQKKIIQMGEKKEKETDDEICRSNN